MRKIMSIFLSFCLVITTFIPAFADVIQPDVKLTADDVTCTYEDTNVTATVTGENTLDSSIKIATITTSGTAEDVTDKAENKTVAAHQKFSYVLKFPDGKEVGTYTMTLTVNLDNGKSFTKDVTVTVEKKKFAVPTVARDYVYTGQEQELELVGFDEKYMTVSETYCKEINAGHYAPIVCLIDTKNTAWLVDGNETTDNQSISWEIERKMLEKPQAQEKSYVYNKTEQTFAFRTADKKLLESGLVKVEGRQRTNAGKSDVTVSITDKQNYAWSDNTTTDLTFSWTIERKAVKEPQTEKTNFDYDGTAKEILFAKNQIDDETMVVANNSRKEVGSQEVTVSLKDKINYVWSSGNDTDLTFTLSVGEPIYALPTIVGTYTYNAKTQHPVLTGFDEETMTIEDNVGKNAGTYTFTIKLKDKANAKWADTKNSGDRKLSWTIQKAQAKVKASNLSAKQGDVVPALNASCYTVSGIISPDRLGFVPTIRYAAVPNMAQIGQYEIVVSGANVSADGNYAVSYENGLLTVGRKNVPALSKVDITFDLPIMGCKDITDGKGITNTSVDTSYASLEIGSVVYEQGTDKDITETVKKDGLRENQRAYVLLKIVPNAGKSLASSTVVTINGNPLSQEDVKLLSEGKEIKFPFTAAAYRIHFSKGKGEGSMLTQYAGTRVKYVIPEATFTAPKGYEFDKWQYKDTDKTISAKESVLLTDSINLVALYKEKKSFIGGGGGGVSGGGGGGGIIEVTPVKDTVQKPTIEVEKNIKYALSKDGTSLTLTAENGYKITSVTVNGEEKGAVESLTGLKTGDIIKATAICALDVQNKAETYNLIARSKLMKTKSGKSMIKVYWYDKNGKKLDLDGYEIYRSMKKSAGYKLKFTTQREKYYNTQVRKGNKYFYKVRGYILFDGKAYYTPWSKKAWQTVR